MSRIAKIQILALCLVLGTGGGIAAAAFTSATSTPDHTFTAAPNFGFRMATGSYVGDQADNRTIGGLGFKPDVVIVKAETNQLGVMRTSTMNGDLTKPLVGATATTANMIQSLTADGFTVGNANQVNDGAVKYYWTAFRAGPGVLKVGSYTGNGTTQSISGLDFSPEYVAVMADSNKDAVNRFSGMTNTYNFEDDRGIAARITSLDANGFSVGANDRANGAGLVYHYVAFNDYADSVRVGTYTGNGADNRDVTGIGWKPAYTMVRANDAAVSRKQSQKSLGQTDPTSSFFRAEAAYSTGIKSLIADGFRLGIDQSVNASGVTYHYLATRNTAAGCTMAGTHTYSASQDTWLNQKNPTETNPNDTTIKVISKANENGRVLLGFSLPTVPPDCTLKSARLRFWNKAPKGGRTLGVSQVTGAWNEATVNWNTQPGVTGTPVTATVPAVDAWMEWTVTDQVQAMLTGPNYGFQVRDMTEGDAAGVEQQFESSESGGDRPQLLVTFE